MKIKKFAFPCFILSVYSILLSLLTYKSLFADSSADNSADNTKKQVYLSAVLESLPTTKKRLRTATMPEKGSIKYRKVRAENELYVFPIFALLNKYGMAYATAEKELSKLKSFNQFLDVEAILVPELGMQAKILGQVENVVYGISESDVFFSLSEDKLIPIATIPGAFLYPQVVFSEKRITPVKIIPGKKSKLYHTLQSNNSVLPWNDFLAVEVKAVGKKRQVVRVKLMGRNSTFAVPKAQRAIVGDQCIEGAKESPNHVQSLIAGVSCDCCLYGNAPLYIPNVCYLTNIKTDSWMECHNECQKRVKPWFLWGSILGFRCDNKDPLNPAATLTPIPGEAVSPESCNECEETGFTSNYGVYPNNEIGGKVVCAAHARRECAGSPIPTPAATDTPEPPSPTPTEIPTPDVPTPEATPTFPPTPTDEPTPTIEPTNTPTDTPTTEPTATPDENIPPDETPGPTPVPISSDYATIRITNPIGYKITGPGNNINTHITNEPLIEGVAELLEGNSSRPGCRIMIYSPTWNAILIDAGGTERLEIRCDNQQFCPFKVKRKPNFKPTVEELLTLSTGAVGCSDPTATKPPLSNPPPKIVNILNYGLVADQKHWHLWEGENFPENPQYLPFTATWFPALLTVKSVEAKGVPRKTPIVNNNKPPNLAFAPKLDSATKTINYYLKAGWWYGWVDNSGDPLIKEITWQHFQDHEVSLIATFNQVDERGVNLKYEDTGADTIVGKHYLSMHTQPLNGKVDANFDVAVVQAWAEKATAFSRKIQVDANTALFCYKPNPRVQINIANRCLKVDPPQIGQFWAKLKKEEEIHCQQVGSTRPWLGWKDGGLADTLKWDRILEIIPAEVCEENQGVAKNKMALELALAAANLFNKYIVTPSRRCWQEYRAKELAGLTPKFGAFHYEGGYEDCYTGTKNPDVNPLGVKYNFRGGYFPLQP